MNKVVTKKDSADSNLKELPKSNKVSMLDNDASNDKLKIVRMQIHSEEELKVAECKSGVTSKTKNTSRVAKGPPVKIFQSESQQLVKTKPQNVFHPNNNDITGQSLDRDRSLVYQIHNYDQYSDPSHNGVMMPSNYQSSKYLPKTKAKDGSPKKKKKINSKSGIAFHAGNRTFIDQQFKTPLGPPIPN